jgi:UDP-3-O-[3-hydroxymyristoyl] glucosamine N-acyltransferase
VEFGDGVVVYSFTNLYGCRIGDGTRIGPFVEIQEGAVVGARCKIQSHSFVCSGVFLIFLSSRVSNFSLSSRETQNASSSAWL